MWKKLQVALLFLGIAEDCFFDGFDSISVQMKKPDLVSKRKTHQHLNTVKQETRNTYRFISLSARHAAIQSRIARARLNAHSDSFIPTSRAPSPSWTLTPRFPGMYILGGR